MLFRMRVGAFRGIFIVDKHTMRILRARRRLLRREGIEESLEEYDRADRRSTDCTSRKPRLIPAGQLVALSVLCKSRRAVFELPTIPCDGLTIPFFCSFARSNLMIMLAKRSSQAGPGDLRAIGLFARVNPFR